jgi:hypothetical protein
VYQSLLSVLLDPDDGSAACLRHVPEEAQAVPGLCRQRASGCTPTATSVALSGCRWCGHRGASGQTVRAKIRIRKVHSSNPYEDTDCAAGFHGVPQFLQVNTTVVKR